MTKNRDVWKKRGLIIKKARESKSLFQKDIAKLLDVGISTVSDYENGVKKIDFDNLKILCKVLDIDISSL